MYAFLLAKLPAKSTELFVNSWFAVLTVIFPLVVNSDSTFGFVMALVFGALFGFGFGLYYSLHLANFYKIVPVDKKAEFVGLYAFFGYIFRFLPPAIYVIVVEAYNDHSLAVMAIAIGNVIAIIICAFIDFEKGERDAQT